MQFQILSHAGLLVQGSGKTLLFDPWLVGSTYWRSWWNYPPVERSLVDSLRPDFIYLTHIHWDLSRARPCGDFRGRRPSSYPWTPIHGCAATW